MKKGTYIGNSLAWILILQYFDVLCILTQQAAELNPIDK